MKSWYENGFRKWKSINYNYQFSIEFYKSRQFKKKRFSILFKFKNICFEFTWWI